MVQFSGFAKSPVESARAAARWAPPSAAPLSAGRSAWDAEGIASGSWANGI
jgi:hypothetical protein